MTQSQKIDELIKRILKEELDNKSKSDSVVKESDVELVTPTGTAASATPDQKRAKSKYKPGTNITYTKAGTIAETEEPTEDSIQKPGASEIAGQLSELMDKLKALSEATEDRKVENLSGRAMKQLEAVKTTLESLTAHEAAILEKANAYSLKEAGKRRKTIEKHLRKRVKMDGVVEKLMKKLPDEKIAEMMKKAKNGMLDEEKVAEAMVKLSLKEGYDIVGNRSMTISERRINELSPNTFKSAINVSKERGTDNRTRKLGQLYFNEFVGKPILGGKITDITVNNPSQGNYRTVSVEVEIPSDSNKTSKKKEYIYYDIDKDIWDHDEAKADIERKDAVVLSKIAMKINPDTKYKETGKYFKIKGY